MWHRQLGVRSQGQNVAEQRCFVASATLVEVINSTCCASETFIRTVVDCKRPPRSRESPVTVARVRARRLGGRNGGTKRFSALRTECTGVRKVKPSPSFTKQPPTFFTWHGHKERQRGG